MAAQLPINFTEALNVRKHIRNICLMNVYNVFLRSKHVIDTTDDAQML
jgi:hypothetical protein